ncbi:MAG: Lrp/AsnC ligand binding domain-containing protein [Candidatus Bathyarchaeia archaeon]
MPLAFVLINAEFGQEKSLLTKLKSMKNVKEAYFVYGIYDIIAKIEAKNMNTVKDIIAFQIRKMNEVKTTLTMSVADVI